MDGRPYGTPCGTPLTNQLLKATICLHIKETVYRRLVDLSPRGVSCHNCVPPARSWIMSLCKDVCRPGLAIHLLNFGKAYRQSKVEAKFHPRTDHEDPEGDQRYSSTLFFYSRRYMGWVFHTTSRPFYPRKLLGTHCIGSWVGTRVDMDGCGKSCPHRDSIRGRSNPQRVVIPTAFLK